MASRTLGSRPPARRRGPTAGLAIALLLLGNGVGHAQTATTGLVSGDLTGSGLEGAGLRGTAVGSDQFAVPAVAPSTDQVTDPDQAGAPPQRLRSKVKAPETSTAKERVGAPKLPPLEPYQGSARARRAGSVLPDDPAFEGPTGQRVFGPTVAALPATSIRRVKDDPTPFLPIGYTVGSLRLTPFVEQSLGYDTNPDQVANARKGSGFSRTEGGFDLLSLWSSNELRANMHGAYTEFFSDPEANRPDAGGTVAYRLDVTRDLAFDAEGRFVIGTQRPGSPNVEASVRGRPIIATYGGSLGGTETLGRLSLGLHGSIDRVQAENGSLSDGTIVRLDDQNYNDYGITGRVAYELTPALKPFVEVTGDTRVHDLRLDYTGFARDSDGVLARVGTTFEIGPLLTGTVSAGYQHRSYQDGRLRDLDGPLVDASLAYAVTPLTILTLSAATTFDETTLSGASGAQDRLVSLQISHALLRNLTLTGIISYQNTDYIGSSLTENTLTGTLKASYNVSRSVVLDASYNHQTLDSTTRSDGFTQDVLLFGVRLQH